MKRKNENLFRHYFVVFFRFLLIYFFLIENANSLQLIEKHFLIQILNKS